MFDKSALPEKEMIRLRSVLNLRDRATNPNEAAAAAAAAARILQQYNLEVAEVEFQLKDMEPEKVDPVTQTYYQKTEEMAALPQWLAVLASAVANACFCQATDGPRTIGFIGRTREATAAKFMFSELIAQMLPMEEAAADAYARDYRRQHGRSYWESNPSAGKKKMKRDFRKSFLTGCAAAIREVLDAQTLGLQQTNTGSAIIISRKSEIEEYMATKFGGPRPTAKVRDNDKNLDAFLMGVKTGQQLGQTVGTKKLGGSND